MTNAQALLVVRDLLILDEAFTIAPAGSPSWVAQMYWEQREAAKRLIECVAEPLVAIGLARRTLYADVEGDHEFVTTLLCRRAPEIGVPLLYARTYSPDEQVREDALSAILKFAGPPQQPLKIARDPALHVQPPEPSPSPPFAGLSPEFVHPLQQRMKAYLHDPAERIREWAQERSELAAAREEGADWTHHHQACDLAALSLWSPRVAQRLAAAKSLLELNRKLGLCILAILQTMRPTRRLTGKAMLEFLRTLPPPPVAIPATATVQVPSNRPPPGRQTIVRLLAASEPLAQAWLDRSIKPVAINQLDPDSTDVARRLIEENAGVRAVYEALTAGRALHG